ncbi:hypothetical protein [cf. Phormidesmis sp. LEGE 11477]|uniref:hypothetical protein n=1 Tax=cf. Phormidesmis sp. LEGE 11477 TaxID=1828680 RepID=UPI0018824A0F|nr:hypothetical protein [cf. Phormidesmis sp. LEGE 11477]MBE9060357.1 hypothetical protein [cf. Phormidesmis sp. LEGE 11477]
MTTTVLPQLQEIESELAAQEESLSAQLAAVQKKLSGIRAVLPMFEQASSASIRDAAGDGSSITTTLPEKADVASSEQEPDTLNSSAKASKPAAKTKAKTTKKKDGRAADWQKYMRPGVKNQSIPDAVKLVLATQPEKGFKIAEVMEALFKEAMPKAQYLKARNRVSNVLSGGVRAGDWHRGDRSTYQMTAA